jgi:DnaJ-class molecular chaperone
MYLGEENAVSKKQVEIMLIEECAACNNTGSYRGEECGACYGTGYNREEISLFQALPYLHLPKEIEDAIYALSNETP